MPVGFTAGYPKGRILSIILLLITGLVIMQPLTGALAETVSFILAYGSGFYIYSLAISAVVRTVSYRIAVSFCKRGK
jgi:hypothetical protein